MPEHRLSLWEHYASYLLPFMAVIVDYAAIVSAELIAYAAYRVSPFGDPQFHISGIYIYGIIPLIFLGFLYAMRSHARDIPFWVVVQRIFWASVYAVATIVLLLYFAQLGDAVSRLFVGLTAALIVFLLWAGRYIYRKCVYSLGLFRVPVLFVGAGLTAERVIRSFQYDVGFDCRIVGFLDDHPVSAALAAKYPILGGFDDAERVIRATGVRDVIITAPGLEQDAQVRLINRIQPLVSRVVVAPNLIGIPMGRLTAISLVSEKVILLETHNNLRSALNRTVKRAFDLVCSILGLIVILPVMVGVAVAIYIDDPGAVVFAHRRIGRNGRTFSCYKFRSMVKDAETRLTQYLAENPEAREEWERDFKLKDDPRITRIGHFLRRTSLDELPQILNVIRGEMSLVGPRPIVQKEIVRYGDLISDYYLVPPGITGLWQVSGRSDTTYDERVQMDSWYVRNWSIWLDFVYLMKTVQVVFKKEGAY
ncbi:undecaprenyl-phosphate galactose phosphotransferase WbaP [Selenomonas sp. FOBRC9]|uniref:undecaprenyl-phosphate galactose phosphotransferase WbaP n=1 Tax=Selenomonas sp. FOBRC9 TaxID=936573 RepID=UPI00027A572A|nr:undecaprenyl-phosphate galactose phosphotransferase WbaP [Selenomonas sp. FOBRC9]EJP32583.1 undecaprenyl-phosphate galactose phosphotransferase WbaP [Selenomonas sp. FOBRC9]